jgi:peptidoglycan/LPS O-acetylase OafA/YrhL
LYFLIFTLGFFILPYFTYVPFFSEQLSNNFFGNTVFYILILPNIALSMFFAVPLIGQSWSIGVEEQFYLIWPILFRLFKKFNFKLLLSFLFFWVLIKLFILITIKYYDFHWLLVLKNNLAMLKFENMIIGAIGALLLFENKVNILSLVYNKLILLLSITGIFISLYIIPDLFTDGLHLLHSIFFLVIILNISSNPNSFIKLENNIYNFLGRISYGIYMYHTIVIYFVIQGIDSLNFENKFFYNCVIYLFSVLITCLTSYFSFMLFEKQFLKLKIKYSKVNSSN